MKRPADSEVVALPADVLERIGVCPADPDQVGAWLERVASEIEPLRFDPRYREITSKLMEQIKLARPVAMQVRRARS